MKGRLFINLWIVDRYDTADDYDDNVNAHCVNMTEGIFKLWYIVMKTSSLKSKDNTNTFIYIFYTSGYCDDNILMIELNFAMHICLVLVFHFKVEWSKRKSVSKISQIIAGETIFRCNLPEDSKSLSSVDTK